MSSHSLKPYVPYIALVLAVVVGALSLFGDNSIGRLRALERALEEQRVENAARAREVSSLRREVRALQSDPRAIEKAARNELGMARPNERVFIFDSSKSRRD